MATDSAHLFGVHARRAVAADAASMRRAVAASSKSPFAFTLAWSVWATMMTCSPTAAGASATALSAMVLLATKPIAKRQIKHTLENAIDIGSDLVLFLGGREVLVMLLVGVARRRRDAIAGGGRSHFEKSTRATISPCEQ